MKIRNKYDFAKNHWKMDWVILLFLVALFLMRLPLQQHRHFDPDEFEHLHASWLVSKAEVPYRDFFEHHTPWLYYIGGLGLKLYDVEASAEKAFVFLRWSRWFSFLLSGAALGLLVWAGRNWLDTQTGFLAAFLLCCVPLFARKTIEFRPDVPAFTFWVASLALVFRCVRRQDGARVARGIRFFWAGACLGAASMFTQKVIFVLPGLAVGLLAWAWWAVPAAWRRARIARCAIFGLGVALPVIITWVAFALSGAGWQFVEKNFLLNSSWTRLSSLHKLRGLFIESWPVVLLACEGCITNWRPVGWADGRNWVKLQICMILAGLLAGLWVMPMPHDQYYLILVPLVALLGAQYLVELRGALFGRIHAIWFYIGLVILSMLPISDVKHQMNRTNARQFQQLEFVMKHTAPHEMMMDGWRGLGVFRPHAFYYYFLHPEIRAILPEKDLKAFLTDLENGKIKPKLIVMDENLQQLSVRFTSCVRQHYLLDAYDVYTRKSDD